MKISHAYLCYSCHEILEKAPHGKCKVCSSDAVYPLGWLERADEERTKWFRLIKGKKSFAENGRLVCGFPQPEEVRGSQAQAS